jgi:chemosensory pili system protein ChpB (putative protein-glutamate methylesterase)
MDEIPRAALRVALLAQDCQRERFRTALKDEGIALVLCRSLDMPLPDDWNDAEVLLVDFENYAERRQVEQILLHSPVPVLLNAGGVGRSSIWYRRLIAKLHTLARRSLPSAWVRPELHLVQEESDATGVPSSWLVVLGASIGGPRAVARFLQALPERLPVTFLLAQHISETYQDLLAEQLDRCSRWPVALLGDTQELAPGQVWLVPAECSIDIEQSRPATVRRGQSAWRSVQRPDIDAVMQAVAAASPGHCGTILFSGLGKDGASGCTEISDRGGFVWVQSAESCAIPNLPEAVRRCCRVEFSGSPEELAQALAEHCQRERPSIN